MEPPKVNLTPEEEEKERQLQVRFTSDPDCIRKDVPFFKAAEHDHAALGHDYKGNIYISDPSINMETEEVTLRRYFLYPYEAEENVGIMILEGTEEVSYKLEMQDYFTLLYRTFPEYHKDFLKRQEDRKNGIEPTYGLDDTIREDIPL